MKLTCERKCCAKWRGGNECEREVVYLDNFGKCVGFVYRDARVGLPADVVADGRGDDERDG
jgi:hypothetical protein